MEEDILNNVKEFKKRVTVVKGERKKCKGKKEEGKFDNKAMKSLKG